MAVTGTASRIVLATNGIATSFIYPYYLFQFSDLVALYIDSAGGLHPLVLNSDYTLSGAADEFGAYPSGVTLTTMGGLSPLGAGGTLYLTRRTQLTQLIEYVDNDAFPATTHEHALDKLTLIAQDNAPLVATSSPQGGTPLTAGSQLIFTVAVPGALPGMVVEVSPQTDPGTNLIWQGFVSAFNIVTVRVTAALAATPAMTPYNVRVFP